MIEERYVANRDQAAAIAKISPRRVDYWASTGIVRPSVDRRLTPHRPIRLFNFEELMSLMVAAELRRRRVSLQHIRVIVHHLREVGYTSPLTQLPYATSNGIVYFQHPDGSWENDVRPNQIVIHEVIELEPLRLRVREAAKRDRSTVGQIEHRRGAMGGKALIAGTRVPVETVRRYLEHGRTPDEVVRAFPALDISDVEAVASVGA